MLIIEVLAGDDPVARTIIGKEMLKTAFELDPDLKQQGVRYQ